MSTRKELEQMLAQGRISRREFIVRSAALGAATALPGVVFPGAAWAATPKRGGHLKMGVTGGETTNSLDPGTLPSVMPQMVSMQCRNCLVEVDWQNKAIPELAESWEASTDAAVWTFKLREGVEFHNGKTMDAEDVVYSINYHRGKNSKSAAKGVVDPIKDVKVDGKNTVVFTLDGGSADFPYLVSDYHLVIVPAGTKGAEFEKGMGTGAYILESWDPGVRATARRNPNYFKKDRGWFDDVETLGIADVNARTNALQTGQIHVMNRCDHKTVRLLEKAPGLQVVPTTGNKHFTFPMRCDTAPFDNNDVRLALKYAIDREQLIKTVLRGYGYLGDDTPIGKATTFYDANLEQRHYDPDKAKFHMKKAGMLDHVFDLHAADAAFEGAVDAAVLYQGQAQKAGIKIKVVREPNDGYWSNVWMKVPWCMSYWSGRPTADWMFSTAYAEGANWNESFWVNKKFNELLKAARAELDENKRRAMYYEMQKIVRDDGGAVIPMFATDLHAATDKLAFDHVAANFEMDGLRLPERWWFA